MTDLLKFILEEITGSKDFDISETEEEGRVIIEVKADPANMGLIIGKGGNTIKAIQTLLRVRGRVENKMVSLSVSEKIS